MRRITKGSFDVPKLRHHVFEDIEKLKPVAFDEKENLDAQRQLMRAAKDVCLLVFIVAFQKHEKQLREEQELIGMLSDIIIENYVMESALLRAQKMLKDKNFDRASITVTISKVLFHDSIDKIRFLAVKALEALEDGSLLQEHLAMIKRLLVSPPINTVALRRVIADSMLSQGRYYM